MSWSKDRFLASPDEFPREKVETPEWASAGLPAVWVRAMTGTHRGRSASEARSGNVLEQGSYAGVLVRCLCDEQGNLLFAEGDVERLNEKSGLVLERLMAAALRINGMTKESVEELEKNSVTTQSE